MNQVANLQQSIGSQKEGRTIAKTILQSLTTFFLIPSDHKESYIWHRSKQIREYNQASDTADIMKAFTVKPKLYTTIQSIYPCD